MKIITVALLMVAAAFAATTVQAERDEPKRYISTGMGAQMNSCALWVKAQQYKKDSEEQFASHAMMISWLQGNFAGRNAYTEPPIAIPPSAAFEDFLNLYCKTDPTITVHEIAQNLWPVLVKADREREARVKK